MTMYCESKIRYAESPRYLVLSWRLNPPYLIYTTACALTALALVVRWKAARRSGCKEI